MQRPLATVLNKKALFLGTLVLFPLLIAISLAVRSSYIAGGSAASASPATVHANVNGLDVEVTRGQIKKTVVLDGELRAARFRTIFANTSEQAKITYLPPEGTTVKAGDRLVELDSGTILDKIKDAEEKIVAADNEIVKTRSTQESTLREMEVELSRLWLAYEQAKVKADVPPDVVSRREYQEYQLALQKTKTEYENQLTKMEQKKKEQSSEIQVRVIDKQKLEVKLNQAKNNLEGVIVRAPSEGMVIYGDHWNERRKIQVGDMVWGGFPIVRLPDLKEMEVLALVNEVDGPKLSVGQKANVLLDSYPDIGISGSVKEIAQAAIKASWMAKAKVFRVFITLDKTVTEIMKPGMSAQVSIVVGESGNHLLVPRSSVKFLADSPQVLRIEGEKTRRPIVVTILASDPVIYAVAENGALKERDRILSRR